MTSSTREPAKRSARLKRLKAWGITLVVATFVACGWVGFVSLRVLFPAQASGDRSDVVVSLAPSHGRLPAALKLFESGDADNLAISWFESELELEEATKGKMRSPAAEYCAVGRAGSATPGVYCFTPERDNTLGEALAVRDLVQEHNWGSVTVVTSSYHAFRAGFIFGRCMPPGTEVQVVPVPLKMGGKYWARTLAYENVAFVKAIFETARQC